MIVLTSSKAVVFSHQDDFHETAVCTCGGECRLAFVVYEESKKESYICEKYRNEPGSMWPHDAIAVAVYICKECMKPISVMNQA